MAQMWEVVGGADKGGILVREGEALTSAQTKERLSTGALIEEIELIGERLHYKLVEGCGTGPAEGWVGLKLPGKVLVQKTFRKPRKPAPETVGPDGKEPLKVCIMFPGQGSQYVKMLEEICHEKEVEEMLAKSKDILGYDILDICLNGPESKLEETRYCQPAMFIGGLAGLHKLKKESPEKVNQCAVMCGLSLGEYTAMVAAGVMTFETGLKLVKLRGEAMQEAAEIGKQSMLSVAGLEKAKLDPLIAEAATKEPNGVCSIANSLFPKGYSIGGTEKSIAWLKDAAEKAGALQAKVLKTAGAFHTQMMAPAQEKLVEALEATLPEMKPPVHTIWMNVSAEPIRPGEEPTEFVPLMKAQLTSPVLWEKSMQEVIKEFGGEGEFFECGPMKQLKAMMKRIDPSVWKKTTNIDV